jgi:addiction module HigA family antidote
VTAEEKMVSTHPGKILLEEFLKPMGLNQNRLALSVGVPSRRTNGIVLSKRRITANTVLRLARYFDMLPQFWLGLQMDYDLDVAEDTLAERLKQEVRPVASVLKKSRRGSASMSDKQSSC